jgi:hypothetical protein
MKLGEKKRDEKIIPFFVQQNGYLFLKYKRVMKIP